MFNYVASTNYGLKEHNLCQAILRKTIRTLRSDNGDGDGDGNLRSLGRGSLCDVGVSA